MLHESLQGFGRLLEPLQLFGRYAHLRNVILCDGTFGITFFVLDDGCTIGGKLTFRHCVHIRFQVGELGNYLIYLLYAFFCRVFEHLDEDARTALHLVEFLVVDFLQCLFLIFFELHQGGIYDIGIILVSSCQQRCQLLRVVRLNSHSLGIVVLML